MNDEIAVEETTEPTEGETNTDETPVEETQTSSEETENTPEVEPEKPKSRASERIRELIAENKRLKEMQRQPAPTETQETFEGVEETGIDPQKFANDVVAKARAEAANIGSFEAQKVEAMRRYPLVAENEFVGAYAVGLVQEGYTPLQAAELATLQYKEQQSKKSQSQSKAQNKSREGTQIPSAGSPAKKDDYFTQDQIDKMSLEEYRQNKTEIHRQLEAGLIE